MNVLLGIPFELRLILLFLVGAALASLVNLVVDRLREETPRYSPWNALLDRLRGRTDLASGGRQPPDRAASRKAAMEKTQRRAARHRKGKAGRRPAKPGLFALLPIVGWFELAATASHDRPRGFWVRPFLVELLFAAGIALLYWYEVGRGGLVPIDLNDRRLLAVVGVVEALHQQFALHVLFLTFMLAASLIDLDEWVIPDSIAVTGTLVALIFATAAPAAALFTPLLDNVGNILLVHLDFTMPGGLMPVLEARQPWGLVLALGCVWLWCFGQLPRVWTVRWGWSSAAKLFFRRLVREQDATLRVLLIGVVLTIGCFLVWWYGDVRWTSLLSALIGLTVGSGIVWTIRIICSAMLRREAMGFGDVTLMAMIGAFLGWQPTVYAFFLSPFFGLIPPIVALLMRAGTLRAVPFGPFLCLGATTTLLLWAAIWPWLTGVLGIFVGLGAGFVFAVIGGALVVLVALLFGLQMLKRAFA